MMPAMIRVLFRLLMALLLAEVAMAKSSLGTIKNYKTARWLCKKDDGFHLVLRSFDLGVEQRHLAVNLSSFKTAQVKGKFIENCEDYSKRPMLELIYRFRMLDYKEAPFLKALEIYTQKPTVQNSAMFKGAVANFGLQGFSAACAPKCALTIDMCTRSSQKEKYSYERQYFVGINRLGEKLGKKIPVGIAISGGYIDGYKNLKGHQKGKVKASNLKYLKHILELKHLDPLWINHSHGHEIDFSFRNVNGRRRIRVTSYEKNFMMMFDKKEFTKDTLKAEQAMLTQGLTPSIFYRFPGLISSPEQIETLRELGLIPLGTNAWLSIHGGASAYKKFYTENKSDPMAQMFSFARRQKPAPGCIVLTHGNRGEPDGVKKALRWLQQNNKKKPTNSLLEAIQCEMRRTDLKVPASSEFYNNFDF